ncbi:MAG TPA: hypothetical protein VK988_14375 [Acidimicrobiales bacterium]|nr:hypothetical protein [Acidimicrobiales bacterium]
MTGCQVDRELPPRLVEVRHTGVRLCTYALHLDGAPSAVTQAVGELADWVLSRVA